MTSTTFPMLSANLAVDVDVDFVQLFRGKNLPGLSGIANGSLCGSYLFSSVVETFAYSTLKQRVWISAHELGQLFGAPHCQGGSDCGIMCPTLCGSLNTFGSNSVQSIFLTKFSATCLDFVDTPAPPLIADVTPTQTQSFNPGWISVAGQGFTMTSSIEIDGEPMNPFFIKVFADGDLQFLPPLLAQAARLVVQPLDALALGGFSIGAVPVAASGFVFESQILTFDIHGVTGTSPIMSTTVFSFP